MYQAQQTESEKYQMQIRSAILIRKNRNVNFQSVQMCIRDSTLINKSFSVIPEEKDITITYAPVDQNEANDSAGMFRSGMDQNYIWEFGSDNCKLYLNGNGYCNTCLLYTSTLRIEG